MNTLPVAFAGMPGGLEWVVIGLVVLLLLGRRLPSVARSLGQSLTEFKSGLAGKYELDGVGEKEADNEKSQS